MVGNSFGLPAGDSCPGKTEWCFGPRGSCYADKLQGAWTSVDRLVKHNLTLLEACGSNVDSMVSLLRPLVEETNWRGEDKIWRWHWDGDVFSRPYAAAIAETCRLTPDVQHYLYTRSFFAVDLLKADNLVVYLSIDPFNLEAGQECLAQNPWVKVAFCARTWADTEELAAQFPGERKGPKCPELTQKIPLVNDKGVGACISCGLCSKGVNNVRFASIH